MRRASEPHISKSIVPDQRLVGAVRRALAESADVDTRELLVDAADGVVYLTGTSHTLYERKMAGRLARNIDGVKRVENDIVIVSDRQPDDEEIFEAIGEALGNYPESNPSRVGVRLVQNGTAYISGKASSIFEAWKAVDIVSKVEGVTAVINEIDIAPGQPVDDIEIKNRVVDAISDDPRVDPFDVNVYVEDADVFLTGEVEDLEALQAAGELASSTPGVKSVINHLHIR